MVDNSPQENILSLYWDPTNNVEDIKRYTKGGFHPIRLGDVISSHGASATADSPPQRYRILHKLGRGYFATVWFAQALHERSQQYVALKICTADGDPEHERSIFARLEEEASIPNVVNLLDTFSLEGPNGVHTVLVYDLLGNPLSFIHQAGGFKHIKSLCHQVTRGLAALHRHGIVHGDVHSGNVGIVLPTVNHHSPDEILQYFGPPQCDIIVPSTELPESVQALPPYLVHPISITDFVLEKDKNFMEGPLQAQLLDLGNSTIVGDPSRPASALPAICAPEILFVAVVEPEEDWPPSTLASDIWSLGCAIYKLAFKTELLDFVSPNFYHPPSDSEGDAIISALVMLWGEVPLEWKSHWDSREGLRSISVSHEAADAEWQKRLKHVTQVHGEAYSEGDILAIFRLLRSILKFNPKSRPTAEDVLKDAWFKN